MEPNQRILVNALIEQLIDMPSDGDWEPVAQQLLDICIQIPHSKAEISIELPRLFGGGSTKGYTQEAGDVEIPPDDGARTWSKTYRIKVVRAGGYKVSHTGDTIRIKDFWKSDLATTSMFDDANKYMLVYDKKTKSPRCFEQIRPGKVIRIWHLYLWALHFHATHGESMHRWVGTNAVYRWM